MNLVLHCDDRWIDHLFKEFNELLERRLEGVLPHLDDERPDELCNLLERRCQIIIHECAMSSNDLSMSSLSWNELAPVSTENPLKNSPNSSTLSVRNALSHPVPIFDLEECDEVLRTPV